MIIQRTFLILSLILSLSFLLVGVINAANIDEVIIQHSNDPNQKTHAYAAKLFWNKRDHIWQRKIVVYGNNPDPSEQHAAWIYVKKLKIPKAAGTKDLYYKRFYKTGNCINKTPLAVGKLWSINFDQNTLGKYQAPEFRENWDCPDWGMGLNLLSIVNGKQAFQGKALRINYLKGVSGCTKNNQCVNWKPKFDGEFTTLYYGYRFKFPIGFPFVKGGKLPGIGGGTSNTNGHKPTGNDGWSVRMMWQKDGSLVQYIYHPDQPRRFGDFIPFDMQPLTLGKWHTLQTRVTLNQAGKKNGIIRTWLDGKIVLDLRNMRFRNGKNLKIDRFLFALFYGGQGREWAPPYNSYSYIDDVRVAPYPVFYKER